MKKLLLRVQAVKYRILGHLYASILYDKKYIKTSWFTGGHHGLFAVGWRWAYWDYHHRKKGGNNNGIPWPVSPTTKVTNPNNIEFDAEDIDNFMSGGGYFQSEYARIKIGSGTYIAPNVGIITANHDFNDLENHTEGKDVIIGRKCWIGMNAVIMPGVRLGDNTIVGANAVVTKSFECGYCVIGGVPAKTLKTIDRKRTI